MKTTGLTFLEAVKALRDGKCGGIIHSDWTQKYAPQVLVIKEDWAFAWESGHEFTGFFVSQMLDSSWSLINPKVEMEEVEVVSWCVLNSDGLQAFHTQDEKYARNNVTDKNGKCVVKLTGTYQRPKTEPEVVEFEAIPFRSFEGNVGIIQLSKEHVGKRVLCRIMEDK